MRRARQSTKADGRTLRSGFLRNAAETPAAAALSIGATTWSYETLERHARVWAHAIVDTLGRPADRVGVFAYRSFEAYAGVLAALFSGAAFVPLNRTFPGERTLQMIERANLDAIIVDAASVDQLKEILSGLENPPPVLAPASGFPAPDGVTVLDRQHIDRLTPLETLPPVTPSDMAYLLFTSGSTGEPKGVGVTHANVIHFTDAITARCDFGPNDRFSQTFDQTFDLSVFDLFVAWEVGACVYVMRPLELLAPDVFVRKHELTVWFSVPSVPTLMRKKNILKPGRMPSLRWSLFCGEPLSEASARMWQDAAPASTVENLYGPTELTIACLAHRWTTAGQQDRQDSDIVPIGRPFPGLETLIVDETLQPVTEGDAGELCVSGGQTVPGYWNDPGKTAERFVTLTTADLGSRRFYRTGDRVRRLADGTFVYLGRQDDQIKVLGHRVELGEIESTLKRSGSVTEAIALGWPMIEIGIAEGIVAFVSGAGIDLQQLQEDARAHLPQYMVPGQLFLLEEMPLNANGKVDRNALRQRLVAGTTDSSIEPGHGKNTHT